MNHIKMLAIIGGIFFGLMLSGQAKADISAIHESIPSPTRWMMQPAENPDKLPDAADWRKDWNRNNGLWRKIEASKDAPMGAGYQPQAGIYSIWVETRLDIPASWKGRNVILDFTSLGGDAIVFVNGKKIDELLNPDSEIDVTSAIDFEAPNRLTVYFTRNYNGISRGYEKDLFLKKIEKDTLKWNSDKHPGIEDRPMGLQYLLKVFCRPKTAAVDIFVIPGWRKKRIDMEIDTVSAEPLDNVVLSADITDADGKVVLQIKGEPVRIPIGRSVQKIGTEWNDFKTWELESPYLYKAQVEIRHKGQVIDKPDAVRFGFREIWKDGIKFMMNGHPMRWRQIHPMGLTSLEGMSFAKLMGYNFFFTPTHGSAIRYAQQDEEFLDRADVRYPDLSTDGQG